MIVLTIDNHELIGTKIKRESDSVRLTLANKYRLDFEDNKGVEMLYGLLGEYLGKTSE